MMFYHNTFIKLKHQLIDKDKKIIKPKLLLPEKTILFIIKHIYNVKKCILFMIENKS